MIWVAVFIAIVALIAVWFVLGAQPLGRNQGREDFEHFAYSLLVLMENGGALHVRRRGSDMVFDLVRAEGDDTSAVVLLRVPRAAWSSAYCEKLRETFDCHGLDVSLIEDGGSPSLMEVRIPVPNVWEEWSGAASARAAHLLLDTLGVAGDARFDFSLVGARSKRALAREKQLRREETV